MKGWSFHLSPLTSKMFSEISAWATRLPMFPTKNKRIYKTWHTGILKKIKNSRDNYYSDMFKKKSRQTTNINYPGVLK